VEERADAKEWVERTEGPREDIMADYVIVGAGSGGAVLINRLSEDPNATVEVIEAGGWDTSPWIHMPMGYFRLMQTLKLDWGYYTVPQKGTDIGSVWALVYLLFGREVCGLGRRPRIGESWWNNGGIAFVPDVAHQTEKTAPDTVFILQSERDKRAENNHQLLRKRERAMQRPLRQADCNASRICSSQNEIRQNTH
jgi:cation diffusion facilitator CzcD-associated flavoprotein CzcO